MANGKSERGRHVYNSLNSLAGGYVVDNIVGVVEGVIRQPKSNMAQGQDGKVVLVAKCPHAPHDVGHKSFVQQAASC